MARKIPKESLVFFQVWKMSEDGVGHFPNTVGRVVMTQVLHAESPGSILASRYFFFTFFFFFC